jgi:sulfur carrier protein
MTVTVNGQRWELPIGVTLAEMLARFGAPAHGVAVAVDGTVVPRASWPRILLQDGAAVDVVTAVQGG